MSVRWERGASPAAAAAVSRALSKAGLRRAVELSKGVESAGYDVSPRGDHVRVEYVAGPFLHGSEATSRVVDGLARCSRALTDRGYTVENAVEPIATPGQWTEGPVLKVRPS